MKKRFVSLTIILLCIFLIIPVQVEARLLSERLLLSMEAIATTVYDVSGFANDGTLYNSPLDVEGYIGRALEFDGDNDYVAVSDANSLDLTTEMTVTAWIYPESIGEGNAGRILDKTSSTAYAVWLSANETVAFGITGTTLLTDGNDLTYNDWNHIACTFDNALPGNEMKIYINGELVKEGDRGSAIGTNTENLYVGNKAAVDRTFNGTLDEIHLYAKALSSKEIQQLMGTALERVDQAHATYSFTGASGRTTGGDVFELWAGGTVGALLLDENFEYDEGDDVPNWLEGEWASNTISVSTKRSYSNAYDFRSMQVYDSGAYGCSAERTFAEQSGQFYVTFFVWVTAVDDCFGVVILDTDIGPYQSGVWVEFATDGTIYWYNNTSPYRWKIQDYSAQTWYNITFDIDVSTETYDIYVDGSLKNSTVAFDETVTDADTIRFISYSGAVPMSEECWAFVDDVKIWTTISGSNTGTAEVTVLYEKLQHMHTQFAVGIPQGLEGLENHNEAYFEFGFDYYIHDAWVNNAWNVRVETEDASVAGASFGVHGNNWIKLKVAWYHRTSLIKTDYLYTFWEGAPGGLVTETTKADYFRLWLDLWFNSINGSSVVGGRLNSYYYGMHDNANPWFQWLTGSAWGPMMEDVSQSMFFANLEDSNGDVFPCSQIELMRVRCKVYRSNNYDFRWQLRDFDILDFFFASGDMIGIDTPIFVATKTPSMAQGGFLAALGGWFNWLGGVFVDTFSRGPLLFWDMFVAFVDGIFGFFGISGFGNVLAGLLLNLWTMVSDSFANFFALVFQGWTFITVSIGKFTNTLGNMVTQWVTFMQTFFSMLGDTYTSGVHLWNDLDLATWVQIGAILYPIYLFTLWIRKGTEAVLGHLRMVLDICAWLGRFFLSIIQTFITVITTIVESIPVVE